MLWFRDKLITQDEETGNIDQNLQLKNVAQQVEGFCISYFAALSNVKIPFVGIQKKDSFFGTHPLQALNKAS